MPRAKGTSSAKTKKTKSSSKGELHSTSITDYIGRLNQSFRLRKRKEVGSAESTDEDRPSTSTGVRKKKGLSVRNSEPMDNSRQDERGSRKKTTQMSQHQPKRKRPQPSNTSTRSQAKRQKEGGEEEQYSERTVSATAASRWKPLSKATRQFVLETLDSAIVNVLNETRPSYYDDVQDRLNILRQRIVGALSALTVPSIRQPDYRRMEEQCHSIEVSVVEASNQVELLENEIEEQMSQIEQKEKLLEELKTDDAQDNAEMIHPILQGENEDKLALPAVKASKVKPQMASFSAPSPSPSKTYHRRLVDALKKWQSQDTVKDIGTFMDTLSNVTNTL